MKNNNFPRLIKELEELILASAGVDPFEEILKLLLIKLYTEQCGIRMERAPVLFERAKRKWPGMFGESDRIELEGEHLNLCMRKLGKIDISKTDLSIIDTAFEYLLPKAAKGSRGQYFTPRHIIKEMVRALNPKTGERVLDPACGSGGFLLHTAKFLGNAYGLTGIDFDERMIRIAKLMLSAAGYKKAKIFRANTLSFQNNDFEQKFDVVLSNPPFGGEIKDEGILKEYDLAKDKNENPRRVVERHILFIEKILNLLIPGGRAGIIVPQGILNNTNLEYVRRWIYSQARILGVIGMDTNTFKPHTNVKTSLLFLQKWKSKTVSDYQIFMSVSERSGKNSAGNLVYKTRNSVNSDLGEIIQDFRKFVEKEKPGF